MREKLNISRQNLVVQVKSLSANAGDTGFNPWSRKFPHAADTIATELSL